MKLFTHKLIMAVAVLLFATLTVNAQTPNTMGNDFWVTFMANQKTQYADGEVNANSLALTLIITARNNCTGRVENPHTGWYEEFEVTTGEITNVTIPKDQCYCNTPGTKEYKGLHITSTDIISLFASNYKFQSFDVTNVLPTESLTDDYMVQTYHSLNLNTLRYPSEFIILATEDNTTVSITPSSQLADNTPADETFDVTLNAGQCYMVQSTAPSSTKTQLSGSRVVAHDCKKIAVFHGNDLSQVPNGYTAGDHLFEQSIPTMYWGKKFVVTSSEMRMADRVKITSLYDNCTVKLDGVTQGTLQAGKSAEFEIQETVAFFETSQPACVFLYLTGYDYYGAKSTMGDPSMTLITPVEQQIDYITFGTFTTAYTQYHFVNVVTETATKSTMLLDGNNISGQFETVPGNPDYSFARIEIDYGSHTLQNTNGGFSAHVYGLGNQESYAYSVGTGMAAINKQMYINDVPSTDYPEGFIDCIGEEINFKVTTAYEHNSVNWVFGDGGTATGDETSYTYTAGGQYLVQAIIEKDADYCQAALHDTIEAIIIIGENEQTYLDYSFCTSSSITINDETYNEPGIYTQELNTILGCDSILTLNIVEVNETAEVVIVGDSIVRIDGSTFGINLTTGEETLIDSVVWSIGYEEWTVTPTENFGCIVNTNEMYPETTPVMLTVTTYNACGTYTTSIGLHYEGEGIEENTANATIFPNPTSGMLNIKADAMKQIRIIDVIGQVLTDKVIDTDDITIDMSQYGNGIYLVEVTTQNGKALKRIVVR